MIRRFALLCAAVTLLPICAAHAESVCKFEKPIEEAFMDAQYRDAGNPIKDARRASAKRVRAMGVLAWAELGVYHGGNPTGVKPGFYGPLRHATDCYLDENLCDQPENRKWALANDKLQKGFTWNEDSIPEFAPEALVLWAEETLNCKNLSEPISFEEGRVTDFSNVGKQTAQIERCEAGNYSDCVEAADYSAGDATLLHLKAAEAGCELGGGILCLSAGQMLRQGGTIAIDTSRSFELLNTGCSKGSSEACFQAGNLASEGVLTGMSHRAVFDLYEKACNLVHQEACWARDRTLADMGGVAAIASGTPFEVSADIQAKFDRATLEEIKWGRYDSAGYVARVNCYDKRIDIVQSCFAAGWIYEHGLGTAKSEAGARGYYLDACKSGSDAACYRYQGLLYEGRGGDRDLYGASDLLARNCRAGDPTACDHYHYGVLTTGAFIPADRLAAAFDYYTWHCGDPRNNLSACYNLAILYDNPGFGRHDETIAKHLANEACSNGGVSGACQLMQSFAYREQQRNLEYSYSQSRGGIGGFLSDLGKGISRSSEIAAGKAATSPVTALIVRPRVTPSTLQAQEWRNFNNAVQAIENTGTAFNSNCPASNPYC